MIWLLGIAIIILCYFLNRENNYYKGRKLPIGCKGLPIIGKIFELNSPDLHYKLEKYIEEFGTIIRYPIGKYDGYFICDAKNIQHIFSKNGDDNNDRLGFRETDILLGAEDELFHSNGDSWRVKRNVLHKALNKLYLCGKIDEYTIEKLNNTVNYIKNNNIFSPHEVFRNMMFDVALKLMTGDDVDEKEKELIKNFPGAYASANTDEFIYNIPIISNIARKIIDKFNYSYVNLLKEETQRTMPYFLRYANIDNDNSVGGLMKNSETSLDDIKRARLLLDIHIAGWGTVEYYISWFIKILANRPDIQEKLQKEFDLGNDNTYYNKCYKELMRYRPLVIYTSFRTAKKDIITLNNSIIPEGSILMYNLWHVHHNKEFWKDPDVYDPERFDENNLSKNDEHENFMPFFTGPRICPGKKIGEKQIYIIMKELLKNFTFKPVNDGEKLDESVFNYGILKQNEYQIKFVERSN